MKKINLLVITSVISLLLCAKSFASDDLVCGDYTQDYGTLTGTLVKLIDRSSWTTTNYVIQVDNGNRYCVRVGNIEDTIRNTLISSAFFLGSRVTVSLTNEHTITGIAIHE
ncbi:hypothetical protein GPY51_14510 [Photorhabdus laumondii subsp. laumondii]|uniref:Uncharacterized protein n=1 Tax=Photorhabdus laumondii subsp. laumondii TaxID=141679 RepID=A0A6L9JQE6_PHOLM|nr:MULTISPECIES: hypothetical protein [Photorhabdus]MCC8383821.1 hypothetical protein [Photorhabdus laumondii]MCC8414499.1 hypothetical protein [Photorhabdus laumondii]NDL21795.1 hypothetical protein [Photorhabdus laumondii subsp. laumondii]NDL30761.1 hypothetical protein [Photorhabdus laumondii subsp. laumondii]NDL35431.1 hypothetical protein [Photorhabdus laumondii subsp. laumondii]